MVVRSVWKHLYWPMRTIGRKKCYDKQYVGDYLASHGYVVLAVDALFWGGTGDVRKEYAMTHSKRWRPICYRWECLGEP